MIIVMASALSFLSMQTLAYPDMFPFSNSSFPEPA